MHEMQRVVCYMFMHNLIILTPYKTFTILPLAILVFYQINHNLEIQ
jgi:hypothetical protein